MKSSILVLGATGSIGYAFAENLISKQIPVTLLVRDAKKATALFKGNPLVEIIQGDAQDLALLKQVSADKSVIFHGINYLYHQWWGNMDVVTEKIIEAASQNKALIVFPGNIYNYGNIPVITEETEEIPCTRKGALRVSIEAQLRTAALAGKCQFLNVRLPDFWGPNVLNEGIRPIFENALAGKALPYMIRIDIPHQMVFTKDAAEIMVRLMNQPTKEAYRLYNYGGQTQASGKYFLNTVSRLANAPQKTTVYPKWLFTVMGWFMPMMKEVQEMTYLFENTVLLDDSKLRKLFPDFKETPLEDAITETLAWFKARPKA